MDITSVSTSPFSIRPWQLPQLARRGGFVVCLTEPESNSNFEVFIPSNLNFIRENMERGNEWEDTIEMTWGRTIYPLLLRSF